VSDSNDIRFSLPASAGRIPSTRGWIIHPFHSPAKSEPGPYCTKGRRRRTGAKAEYGLAVEPKRA
jgi:hypothetical protein